VVSTTLGAGDPSEQLVSLAQLLPQAHLEAQMPLHIFAKKLEMLASLFVSLPRFVCSDDTLRERRKFQAAISIVPKEK
jgi:hypothetical protein